MDEVHVSGTSGVVLALSAHPEPMDLGEPIKCQAGIDGSEQTLGHGGESATIDAVVESVESQFTKWTASNESLRKLCAII